MQPMDAGQTKNEKTTWQGFVGLLGVHIRH
jgi:hypothetical protein